MMKFSSTFDPNWNQSNENPTMIIFVLIFPDAENEKLFSLFTCHKNYLNQAPNLCKLCICLRKNNLGTSWLRKNECRSVFYLNSSIWKEIEINKKQFKRFVLKMLKKNQAQLRKM